MTLVYVFDVKWINIIIVLSLLLHNIYDLYSREFKYAAAILKYDLLSNSQNFTKCVAAC